MTTTYRPAPSVARIAEGLIPKHHPDLADFITHLAAAWEASLDLDPADIDGETHHVTWKAGRLLDRPAPGTTEGIVTRRIEASDA